MDGISKALNTSFKEKDVVEEIKQENDSIDVKLNELNLKTSNFKNERITITDKNYIKEELISLLASVNNIIQSLEDEIKRPPCPARLYESYSMVVTQSKEILRELRMLNVDAANLELTQRKMDKNLDGNGGSTNIQNNMFFLDAKQLDNMISKAKQNSLIDQVEVDFKVESNIK